MSDNTVLVVPQTLADASLKYQQKSQDILNMHSDLDSFSDTLYSSLPDEKSQQSIDKFWSTWSKNLLGLATAVNNIGGILYQAAITYIQTDAAIAAAFRADPSLLDQLKSELNQIYNNEQQFQTSLTNEQNVDTKVSDRLDGETKDITLHNGQNTENEYNGLNTSTTEMRDVTFRVDANGNITEVWTAYKPNWDTAGLTSSPIEKTKSVNQIYFNGHWVQAGSDEAKAIHNGTDGGTTSEKANDLSQPGEKQVVVG